MSSISPRHSGLALGSLLRPIPETKDVFSLDEVDPRGHARLYNDFLSVENVRDILLQEDGFNELLFEMGRVILKYDLEDCLGLKLVYRDFTLEAGQVMLESFALMDGEPALITSACSIAEARKLGSAPSAWIPGYEPGPHPTICAFSTDPAVREAMQRIQKCPEIFIETGMISKRYAFHGCVAVAILARHNVAANANQVYQEVHHEDVRESVVQLAARDPHSTGIRTSWSFKRQGPGVSVVAEGPYFECQGSACNG